MTKAWHWHDEKEGFVLAGPCGGTILVCKSRPDPSDRAAIAQCPAMVETIRALVDTHDAYDSIEYHGAPAGTHLKRSQALQDARAILAAMEGEK